jgi:sugar phosphate isomerase/epimerase
MIFWDTKPRTVEAMVAKQIRDMKLASRLGFTTLRQQNASALGFGAGTADVALYGTAGSAVPKEFIEKVLPYAEQYNTKMAVELHSPVRLKSLWIDNLLEFIQKKNTKHLGFTPDMSMFSSGPNKITRAGLVESGARERIVEHIVANWRNDVPPETTMAEVKKMDGNAAELRFASLAGIYHASHNDPKDLVRLIPYMYHLHAKFTDITDDLREPDLDYDRVVPLLAQGGFNAYWSSEYEGTRDPFDASWQVRRQHLMIRRLWDGGL